MHNERIDLLPTYDIASYRARISGLSFPNPAVLNTAGDETYSTYTRTYEKSKPLPAIEQLLNAFVSRRYRRLIPVK